MKQVVLLLSILLFFIGCTDKKEEKSVVLENTEVGQIEVVENKDYKKEKIKDLETKDIVTGAKANSFYYDYGKKNNLKKEVKEEKTYTPMDANMRVRTPYDEVRISLLVKKLSKKFIVKCSACHSDYANGIIGPSLLGKDKDFIYGSIMDFKTGKKENVLMNDLIHLMSNKEIEKLAVEIAKFNEKIKKLREQK